MKRRRVLYTAAIVLLLVALYALAGFVWAPRLVASQVRSLFQQEYGRSVSLGAVRINPFTFEFEARDFTLPDADGRPMLGFGRLYFNFELSSLWHRAWTFREIEIEQPYVRVVQRRDGRLNLLDLAPPASAPAGGGHPAGGMPAVRIDDLGVTAGRADIEDAARAQPFATTLEPFTFRLSNFRTSGDSNAFAFTAGSDLAGRLSLSGTFAVEPFASRGSVTLTGLQAKAISEYLGDLLPVVLESGTLDLGLNYDFSLAGRPYRFVLDMPSLAVHDLATVARDQDTPWHFPSIEVADTHVDVAARSVLVKSIAVDGVDAPAWLDAKGLNLPGLPGRQQPAAGRPSPPAARPTGPDWTVSVPSIRLAKLSVPFEDRRLSPPAPLPFTVQSVSVHGFAWPVASPLQVDAVVESGAGGQVSASGTLRLDPLGGDLDVGVDALDLRPVQPYLDGRTDLLFQAGKLDASGKLHLAGTQPLDVGFSGRLAVTGLHTQDRVLKQDLVNWQALELTGVRFTSRPAKLDIAEVVAHRPYARLVLDKDGISNIEMVLHPDAAAAKAAGIEAGRSTADAGLPAGPRASASKARRHGKPAAGTGVAAAPALPVAISIRRTRIVDGNLNFADFTTVPDFHIAMEALNGTITGSSSDPTARATVNLDGKVDRYAPAHIDGQVNLLAPRAFVDLGASFRNIELTSFNPYSTKFIGYQIDKGKLSIDTRYKVDNDRLQAEHKITIDQLEFGDKIDSPDAIGLPIKLAVALLKDSEGVMELELPIAGTVDDPQFKLSKIIWKAFVGLLTKAVTAPFKLLGSLFGGGADLSYIDFTAGAATLDAAARDKLASLAKALIERPNLKLDIPWTAAAGLDKPAIEQARWDAAVSAAGRKTPDNGWQSNRAQYLERLEALYRQKTGHKPELAEAPKPAAGEAKPDPVEFAIRQLEPGLKADYAASDEDIDALAQARAEAVRDALLADGKIDPSRVFVVRGEPADAGPTGVRMKLALK